ncbi:MAG: DNA-binding domain-containing protein [Alphaproteobacteria bacterium]|nr:DNA-binding domain-containing protein [Alphaproteobacteria bacterium]
MSRLAELQSLLQNGILAGDNECDGVLAVLRTGNGAPVAERFGIYTNAYRARLVEIVGKDHELLVEYMGEDLFNRMALEYVDAHPSSTTNARYYSRNLSLFLAENEPYKRWPQMAEIVSIQTALDDAFDSEDNLAAGLEDLSGLAPEQWAGLVFEPHSSVRTLEATTNAFEIWSALKAGHEAPPPEILDTKLTLIVWRQDLTPKVRPQGYEEAMLWKEAGRGVAFGVLCEMAATFDQPETAAERAASYLAGWLNAGLLASARTC